MTSIGRRLLPFAFALGLTVTLWMVQPKFQHWNRERRLAELASLQRTRVEAWQRLQFAPNTAESVSEKIRQVLNRDVPPGVDRVALSKFEATIVRHFAYQANPEFDEFYQQRAIGGGFTNFVPDMVKKVLNSKKSSAPEHMQTDPIPQIEGAWNHFRNANITNGVTSLTGVCLESLKVSVVEQSSPPNETLIAAKSECVTVARSFNSGFDYDDGPRPNETPVKRLYASLQFVGKLGPSDEVSPFYVMWFWSPAANAWRPASLLLDMHCRYSAMY